MGISFKEFVMSMRKGSLNKQISDLANNEFPSLEQIGSLIIESVRVEIGDDCLKIIPEFTKSITISSDHENEADTFDETPITQKQAPTVRTGSCGKYPSTVCSARRTKKRERRSQKEKHTDLLNELKAKTNDIKAEKTDSQKQISKRPKGCSNKHSIGAGSKNKTKDKNEINYLRKRLNGRVSDMVMKIEPNQMPSNSAGYRWQRDFDSTDDENIWERIGSIFSGSDRSSTRSNNPSVSSGDYCIHN